MDRNSFNSAATEKTVKDIIPFTKNNLYREFSEEFYDFSDASNNKLTKGASGVTFTGVNPSITFLQNDITHIDTDGLRTKNNVLNLTIPQISQVQISQFVLLCRFG